MLLTVCHISHVILTIATLFYVSMPNRYLSLAYNYFVLLVCMITGEASLIRCGPHGLLEAFMMINRNYSLLQSVICKTTVYTITGSWAM